MKIFNMTKDEIQNAVKNGKVTIAVYGLGNVGLPIALAYFSAGCNVIGVDIDHEKVDMLNSGINFLSHEPYVDGLLKEALKRGKFRATTDLIKTASEADVISILVPTLADASGKLKLNALFSAARAIGKGLQEGSVIILESTVPPGTTEGPLRKILEKESGLMAGEDFGLAFSPERVKSGTVIKDFLENYPKIVGGINDKSTDIVANFYEAIIRNRVIRVRNARTAEAAKVFKGVYRYVNIALANELAIISEHIGVDVKEVIDAANTEPYSHIHHPGAGVGGHCIPVYPLFLTYIAGKLGVDLKLTQTARIINNAMPFHVVNLVIEGLNEAGKPVKGSKITIFGLTFRGDVKATYLSPAKPIIERLKRLKARIVAHDPYLTDEEVNREFGVKRVDDIENAFVEADCVVFVADHKMYSNLNLEVLVDLMNKPPVIIDGRNIFDLNAIKNLDGVIYRGVGRGGDIFAQGYPEVVKLLERDLLGENLD